MRFIVHLLSLVVIALGLGFGLSYYTLTDGRIFAARSTGAWATWPDVGAANPDPYTKAFLARQGILQLGDSEGNQFVAETDENGLKLNPNCTYLLDGETPIASLWTLTAVDYEGKNILASNEALYLDNSHIARSGDGTIVINVSKTLQPQNWLEISGDVPFRLILTLYDTAAFSDIGARELVLPAVLNKGCS